MEEKGIELNVRVPKAYAKAEYLDAIGMGLFDLAIGKRPDPEEVAEGELITVRLPLSPRATTYFNELLPQYKNNKRQIIREALCLISKEPKACLCTRI